MVENKPIAFDMANDFRHFGDKMTKVLEKNHETESQKTGLDAFL